MSENREKSSSLDIFQLLEETTEKEKKKQRAELLTSLGVMDFFVDGSISINMRTCQGVECKLCIEVCPTTALYWRAGEVGITPELCIYCGACVLNCIIDDCIKIARERSTGEIESFSNPRDVVILQHRINTRKRLERIQDIFPKPESYLKWFNACIHARQKHRKFAF